MYLKNANQWHTNGQTEVYSTYEDDEYIIAGNVWMAKIPTHPFLLLYHLTTAILGDVKMQYASLLRLPLPLLLLYYCRQPNHMLEQPVVYKNQEENSRWPISTVALTEILFNCSPGLPVFMSIFNLINGKKVKSITTQRFPRNGSVKSMPLSHHTPVLPKALPLLMNTSTSRSLEKLGSTSALTISQGNPAATCLCCDDKAGTLTLHPSQSSKKTKWCENAQYLHAEGKLMCYVVLQTSFGAMENDIMVLLNLFQTKKKPRGRC